MMSDVAGPEAEIAKLFLDLRNYLGRTQREVAVLVSTDINVIIALETGNIAQLPSWNVVERVVRDYLDLAAMDPEPVLHVLGEQLGVRSVAPAPEIEVAPPVDPMPAVRNVPRSQHQQDAGWFASRARRWRASQADVPVRRTGNGQPQERTQTVIPAATAAVHAPVAEAAPEEGHGRRPLQRLRVVALVVTVAAILLFQAPVLDVAVAYLPQPVGAALVQTREFVLLQLAPERDGMRWIEVDDPRSRRADKLPVKSP